MRIVNGSRTPGGLMTVTVSTPDRAGVPGDGERYTIEELARRVGMSARNVRAHQARRLLAPPVRVGRTVYYDAGHVRRIEAIKALQRQGFNLVAIDAILGTQSADPETDQLATMLRRLGAEQPALVYALTQHGVVGRADDGTVRTVRPRALRAALELRRGGVPTVPSLQILAEVLDALRDVTDELVRSTCVRLLAARRSPEPAGATSWEQYERDTVVFTQCLVGLFTEAFRLTVENHGRAAADLMAGPGDLDFDLDESELVDNG
jgi:DNA-binding transcriptional MerR regulator